MSLQGRIGAVLTVSIAIVVASCGDSDVTRPEPVPTFISLRSDAGDFIGAGQDYDYDQSNAVIEVTESDGLLSVSIDGDELWHGEFQAPSTFTSLTPGTYTNLERYPFHDPARGGLSWSGEGRGCNTLTGSFTVDTARYALGILAAVDLTFEQHCEGGGPALRGTIHWRAGDASQPAGPVRPIPGTLWQPPAGAVPATGDFVYLTSQAGDFIGQGQTYTYTPANATISATATDNRVTVGVSGAQSWVGEFQAMNSLTRIETGYYPDLERFPFHNPAKGGLSWTGESRACNTLRGWFAVDRVTYSGSALTAIELRFEQRCEGGTAALRGAIRWSQ
jgi:hypothetical protein